VSLPFPPRVDRRRALDRLADELAGDSARTALFRAVDPPGGARPADAAAEGSLSSSVVSVQTDLGSVARVRRPRPGAARAPWEATADLGRLVERFAGAGNRTRVQMSAAQRGVRVVAVVLCVLAVGLAWSVLRRPVAADESLPRAGDPTESALAGSLLPGPGRPAGSTPAGDDPPGPIAGGVPAEGVLTVHVAGAVASPGVVRLPDGSRVVDAVVAAGGLRPDADPDRVNLAARLVDAQRVVVPVAGQPVPAEVIPAAPGAGAAGSGSTGAPGAPDGPIDLNTASAAELETLPGVGPATAAAIVDHRTRSGPFRSVDGLLEVRGIGEAKLGAVRDLVTVGG
jgi:competence protein ComEA